MVKADFSENFALIRGEIKKGRVRECLNLLEEFITELPLDEDKIGRITTDLISFQSRLSFTNMSELHGIASDQHILELNQLIIGIAKFLDEIEKELKLILKDNPIKKGENKHRVELILDMDFDKVDEAEIKAMLDKIKKIIKTNPDELIIMNIRPGSIIVETELTDESIKKIQSIVKLGLVKGLTGIEVFNSNQNRAEESKNVILDSPNNEIGKTSKSGGVYLHMVDLGGENLKDLNLGGANLMYSNLSGADMKLSNLSGADLSGADLSGADLSGVDLSGADLSGANINGANLSGANLSGTHLRGAHLMKTDLSHANLFNANLSFVNLFDANLSDANLNDANLDNSLLLRTDLSRANLISASLIKAGLVDTRLIKTNLSKANLSGAYLSGADLSSVNLSQAHLKETIVHISQSEILKTMNVDISEVIFVDHDREEVESLTEVE